MPKAFFWGMGSILQHGRGHAGMTPPRKKFAYLTACGLLLSLAWIAGCYVYVADQFGVNNLASLLPHELGSGLID